MFIISHARENPLFKYTEDTW